MARMRVLHIQRGLFEGGTETFLALMVSALQDVCESRVFSLESAELYEGPDIPRVEQSHKRIGRLRTTARLWQHVKSWQPEIIHAHSPIPAVHGAILKALARRPVRLLIQTHVMRAGPLRTPMLAWLEQHSLSKADALVACSDAALASVLEHAPHAPSSRYRLYNPVSIDMFTAAQVDAAFRPENGISSDETLGLFVGRLSVWHKGLDVICSALKHIEKSCPLHVCLVGPGDTTSVRAELALSAMVSLPGPVDHRAVPGLLKAADFFLYPSRTEAFGISIIEAMAAGLPVVSTQVDGILEVVEDGVTGILVPPEDPVALAEAMRWMVEHPEERKEMGRRGQERAKLFDVTTIAAQLEEIYREVLDG